MSDEEREVHGLRVAIDRTLCVGFGDCITESPGAFRLDEEGVAVFDAPASVSADALLRACRACPVDAITVHDAEGRRLIP